MKIALLTISQNDYDQVTQAYVSVEAAKQAVRKSVLAAITLGEEPEKEDYDELEEILELAHDDADCWHLDEVAGGSYEIVEMLVREKP